MYQNSEVCKQFSQITHQNWTIQGSKGKAWVVYLYGNPVEIVWFEADATASYVKQSLIHQDGYSKDITVGKSN